MRRGLMVAALLLLATAAQAQTFPLGQALTAAWEPTANEAAAGVDRYEVRVDVGAWAPVTPVGLSTYRAALPAAALTVGAHTVTVRACAATVCGVESSLALTIGRPVPGAVPGLRVAPTSAPIALSIPRAIEYVQAYALWAVDRPLTDGELAWLAQRHGALEVTKASVASVLESAWPQIAPQ